MNAISSSAFADSKPHYEVLDGLRGVAALLVVFYHVFEGFGFAGSVNGAGNGLVKGFNHGYLAVDFFFILSGFVIGYAYDDRWGKGFTKREFFRRRLIRLHPMVVMGAVIGLAAFLVQGSVRWDGTLVAFPWILLSFLCALFMIPAVPGSGCEVRGNGEMFPLNGPTWSLFFEYVGNLLYGFFLHRLPTKVLGILAALLGLLLAWFTIGDVSGAGFFGVGWTLDGMNFFGGMLRMLFPYTLGMFLSRIFKPVRIRGSFWIGTATMLLLFSVPYIPAMHPFCMNGLFEACCILLVFPAMVWAGASEQETGNFQSAACKMLGDLSYPLYIIHYPSMYLFYGWMIRNEVYTWGACWPQAVGVMAGNVLLALLLARFYDRPVRKFLSDRRSGKITSGTTPRRP